MKFLKHIAAILSLCATAIGFPTEESTAVLTNAPSQSYSDFAWKWSTYSDRKITVSVPSGFSNVMMRMAYPINQTYWLTIEEGSYAGSTWTTTLSHTNIPPNNTYFTEFLGYSTTNIGGSNVVTDTRVVGAGKITTLWSVYNVTNAAAWTPRVIVYSWDNSKEIDPKWNSEKAGYASTGEVAIIETIATNAQATADVALNAATNPPPTTQLMDNVIPSALALACNDGTWTVNYSESFRTAIGLGSASTKTYEDFATSAQGALADTAVQPMSSALLSGLSVTTSVGNAVLSVNSKDSNGFSRLMVGDYWQGAGLTMIRRGTNQTGTWFGEPMGGAGQIYSTQVPMVLGSGDSNSFTLGWNATEKMKITTNVTTVSDAMWRREQHKARITITFADGYASVTNDWRKLLEGRGIRGTVYLITTNAWLTPTFAAAYREMQTNGWEFGSHSQTHVLLSTCTPARVVSELVGSKSDLISNGLYPTNFLYPYGAADAYSQAVILSNYVGGALWGINYSGTPAIHVNTGTWWLTNLVKAVTIADDTIINTVTQMCALVDSTIAQSGWLVVNVHNITGDETNRVGQFIDYAQARGMTFQTMQQAQQYEDRLLQAGTVSWNSNANVGVWGNLDVTSNLTVAGLSFAGAAGTGSTAYAVAAGTAAGLATASNAAVYRVAVGGMTPRTNAPANGIVTLPKYRELTLYLIGGQVANGYQLLLCGGVTNNQIYCPISSNIVEAASVRMSAAGVGWQLMMVSQINANASLTATNFVGLVSDANGLIYTNGLSVPLPGPALAPFGTKFFVVSTNNIALYSPLIIYMRSDP